MRIGSRISLTTVTLVMVTLGVYSYVTLRTRRAEVRADLERQSLLVGGSIQVALEAAARNQRWKEVSELVARWQGAEPSFTFNYIDLEHSRPGLKPPGFTVPR